MLDAISLFSKSGVIDLRFTGGEVTMRKDWDILLSHAKKLGFIISVNTNGAYKSKKIVDKFISIRPNQITFSIDGIGARHDETRGEGSFDKLVNNMRQLSDEGLNLRLNCTLSKKNIDEVDNILLLAEKYCKEINFFGLREIGEGAKYNYSLSFDEFSKISKYVQSKSNERLYVCGGHQIMNEMSINVNDHELVNGSPDLTTRFNITSDGTYYSGGYLPFVSKSLALGKVYDSPNSLYEIWHNSKKLREIRLASQRLKEECYGCREYGNTCNGGIFELELQKKIRGIENPYCIKNVNIFEGVESF
jgi:radical SAM protein with 4Fe4S-binding SPASM domain